QTIQETSLRSPIKLISKAKSSSFTLEIQNDVLKLLRPHENSMEISDCHNPNNNIKKRRQYFVQDKSSSERLNSFPNFSSLTNTSPSKKLLDIEKIPQTKIPKYKLNNRLGKPNKRILDIKQFQNINPDHQKKFTKSERYPLENNSNTNDGIPERNINNYGLETEKKSKDYLMPSDSFIGTPTNKPQKRNFMETQKSIKRETADLCDNIVIHSNNKQDIGMEGTRSNSKPTSVEKKEVCVDSDSHDNETAIKQEYDQNNARSSKTTQIKQEFSSLVACFEAGKESVKNVSKEKSGFHKKRKDEYLCF
ncbi:hypothetical protein BB559_005859, partial [Furculomyces boomerangus]